jgi:hypothetical protein
MTFAVHTVHLGDESEGNWVNYGYDLDGKVTTASSSDVCTLYSNANPKNQADGLGGIDNSFGENIVPLLGAVAANPSTTADSAFEAGKIGWILSVRGLSADLGQSAIGLTGEFFLGAPFGQAPNSPNSTPSFTLADVWPLDPTTVASPVGPNGLLAVPTVSVSEFPKAYVTNGNFVSGIAQPIELELPIGGVLVRFPVQHAIVTFSHATATQAGEGILAGVIATEDLVQAIQRVAGSISTSLCSTSTFAQIKKSIEQASDILVDGTNRAGVPCNAISIGIGFSADAIHDPQYAGTNAPTSNPCGDGG